MSGIRINQVPMKYWSLLADNLLIFRPGELGVDAARRNVTLSEAFPWSLTEQGHDFWYKINNEEDPESNTSSTVNGEKIEDVVTEAESRGFADGVNTKYGLIKDEHINGQGVLPHELCSDGSFYYRNIKVRNSKGKWIKPIPITVQEIELSEQRVAIHKFFESIGIRLSSMN